MRSIDKTDASRRLYGIETGRGLAAVFVLLSHASAIIAEPRFYGTPILGGAFAKFGAGVDFFFVLSGFIIAWIHWGDIGRPDRLGRYASRRFRRIYPPYWGVLVPLSLAYALFPTAGEPSQHDPVNFVFSFLLLPYPEHPILGVAWTLVYEIVFYAIFGLLILTGRKALWLLVGWGVAVLATNVLAERLTFPFTILLDVRNLQFLMGIAAAFWVLRGHIPAPRALTIVGAALFVAQMLIQHPLLDDPLVGRLGFGIAAVLGIVGVVGWERDRGLVVTAPFRLLGAASYAIYLVHGIAISFAIQIVIRIVPRDVPLILPFAVLAAAGVTAGVVYHLVVEKPLLAWLGRRGRTASSITPASRVDHVG